MNKILYIIATVMLLSCGRDDSESVKMKMEPVISSYVAIGSDPYPRNTEGDCIELEDGTLLCAFTRFEGYADIAPSCIVGALSRDHGRTWSVPTIICGIGLQNVMSVSLIEVNQKIHLYFLIKNSDTDLQVYRMIMTDGYKWGKPECIQMPLGYCVVVNGAVVYSNESRLYIPVCFFDKSPATLEDKSKCFYLYSDDEGNSWDKSDQVVIDESKYGGLEPTIVELSSDKVLMSMRTDLGFQYFAYFDHNGKLVKGPVRSSLPSSDSPAHLISLKHGELLAVHNNCDVDMRNRLSISLSLDEGDSWNEEFILEESANEKNSFSYPSLKKVGDRLLITYWEFLVNHYSYSLKFASLDLNVFL